jgi:nucleotide-binding universal stress UspA family protein
MALVVVLVVTAWVAAGACLAVVMRRRGHELFPWLLPGVVFGPLLVPYAWDQLRRDRDAHPHVFSAGAKGTGAVDVLVGLDGSPESRAAMRAAVALLGPRIGRFALATVLDFETAMPDVELLEDAGWVDARRRFAAELAGTAATIEGVAPATVLLGGPPARSLAEYAEEHGYELLVIGRRGKGLSKMVLGSVASELVHRATVPVLIAGH